MIRSGSASSTRNGPISVRRSVDAVTAERVRDRADVRPRGDVQLEPRDAVRVPASVELVDVHRAHRHLDGDAAAVERVRALAVDLHRRRGRDREVDRAAQAVERRLELVARRRVVLVDALALDVAGRRARRQVDLRHVALRQPDEPRLQPRRRAREEQQEPGRERIERPRVPGPRPGPPPHRGDDRERRRPGGLVDEDDPARRAARAAASTAPRPTRPAP